MTGTPTSNRFRSSPLAVIGAACRLPKAADEAGFWSLLDAGACAVGDVPAGRWRSERFWHPRRSEPGFSYTFRGGYLDNAFDFDPSVFGISPREASQIDPQQRLLMEVVWEALENAGIAPSSVARKDIGVYVGASSLDYGNLHASDPASIDSHFMTGNTLSIVSNRISYIFDWTGPTFTVDTACSSSMVAFNEAMAAVESGRVDMAVVAGVNMLLSPASFIGFSRASMLSPTGLCRPFSADGDGYVRAEGAVAFVLERLTTATANRRRIRAVSLASGLNSDGRTSGISLPSSEGQFQLLDQLYGDVGLDPRHLAFVEAHGTGTRVGDPAEAIALGKALGQRRTTPLPIGSVKSNIGHLEPASGLAGMFKAILAMEHGVLPRSLHAETLNPIIDFDDLNIHVATSPVALAPSDAATPLHCAVSSFGFGGTNAHAILRAPTASERALVHQPTLRPVAPDYLVVSAQTRDALRAQAARYADRLAEPDTDLPLVAAVSAHHRDRLPHRLAVPLREPADVGPLLRHYAEAGSAPGVVTGTATASARKICFVFAGNGCQWPGMGRVPYARNSVFRARMQEVEALFRPLAGWSLIDAIHDPNIAERLKLTSIAQPLLFALQSAATVALADYGLVPSVVLGHSVGEVAAAEASGALSLSEAVRVIYRRSESQEAAHGRGKMAVLALGVSAAEELIAASGIAGIEIAAVNAPSSVTISGPSEAITALVKQARARKVVSKLLAIDYPFHSSLLDPIAPQLLANLADLAPRSTRCGFISTVTGARLDGSELNGAYWWHNVRDRVRFQDAVSLAAADGADLFVEIGATPILQGNIAEIGRQSGHMIEVTDSFSDKETDAPGDPVRSTVARAFVRGAAIADARLLGSDPGFVVDLPTYAFQRKSFTPHYTAEALDVLGTEPRHPLIGARMSEGTPEWRTLIDATIVPYLADHVVDREVLMPAAGFAEMALAVARELNPEGPVGLEDFDILQPMLLAADAMREVSVRHAAATASVEVWSRARFSPDEWTLHARGRIAAPMSAPRLLAIDEASLTRASGAEEIYATAARAGLDYGPRFRLAASARRSGTAMILTMAPAEPDANSYSRPHVLHPARLDATFHGLFLQIKSEAGQRKSYLPVRFGRLSVYRDDAEIASARLVLERETEASITGSIALLDADGTVVANLDQALFRAVILSRDYETNVYFRSTRARLRRVDATSAFNLDYPLADAGDEFDGRLIFGAFGRQLAFQSVEAIVGAQRTGVRPEDLVASDRIHAAALPLLIALLRDLEQVGLATESDTGWTLAETSDLPPAGDILSTMIQDFPSASAEIVLSAHALTAVPAFLRTGTLIQHRSRVVEQFFTDNMLFDPLIQAVDRAVRLAIDAVAPGPVRIALAEPGCLPVARLLAPLVASGTVTLSIIGSDRKKLDRAASRIGQHRGIEFLAIDTPEPEALYDLALVFTTTSALSTDTSLLRALAARVAGVGTLLIMVPPADPALTVLFGATEGWFDQSISPTFPIGAIPTVEDVGRLLLANQLLNSTIQRLPDRAGAIASVKVPSGAEDQRDSVAAPVIVAGPPLGPDARGQAIIDRLRAGARTVVPVILPKSNGADVTWADRLALVPRAERIDIVHLGFRPRPDRPGDVLRDQILDLSDLLQTVTATKRTVRLFLCTGGGATTPDPVGDAVWAFGRVATNEYPHIDIRMVEIDAGLSAVEAAERLALVVAAPGRETEFILTRSAVETVRIQRDHLPDFSDRADENAAAHLNFPRKGALEHFSWTPIHRRAPEAHEIEIEVLATGLNFRDVMLAMGLLDDDVLDDGLAGAVLGFECSGRVVRTGTAVTRLKPGDVVMGFASQAFSTHVTADERVFMAVPEGMPAHAAATIPVAFTTAWYALIELARIKAGEWVLIHGAAGGVGIAAIQIARMRGARIAATVGSADKRALVEMLGAERVYDSRSLAFADAVRADTGGVDVVLNSLFGDAMAASVKCLKPFGRFIELGKRDYVQNTSLGLRPFRRNLTYFGVDIDQLLAAHPDMAGTILGALHEAFEAGALSPLPYRRFGADEIAAAFRLMQSAGHVGKLIVEPPRRVRAPVDPDQRFVPGEGAHLVVGGTSGFGFKTCLWLAEQGARTIIAASRRGEIDASAADTVAALAARGITLTGVALDVTDADAVEALLARLERDHGRVAGVIHTAAVLADGMISGLNATQLAAVLAPKVVGGAVLDRATRTRALDYFVVYSSATTLIGNPGQPAYVAANGYLEGLVRARRAAGLPGLAIGWGAIADAGILARDPDTARRLERLTGVAGMPSHVALGHLGELLAGRLPTADGVVFCADIRPVSAHKDIRLFASPTFAGLFGDDEEVAAQDTVDLRAQIEGKSDVEATRILGELFAAEVARILRQSPEEVGQHRSLAELGMDSLMALELRMGVEKRFGIELPLVAITSVKNIDDLARRALAQLRSAGAPASESVITVADEGLVAQHGDEISAADLEDIGQIVNAHKQSLGSLLR